MHLAGRPIDVTTTFQSVAGFDHPKTVLTLSPRPTAAARLEEQGIEPVVLSHIEAELQSTSGLVLITGPQASSQETLQMIIDLADDHRRLLHVGKNASAETLQHLQQHRRSDVLVATLDDSRLVQKMVHAARSGQLVVGILDAGSVAEAIQTILAHGVSADALSTAINAVLLLHTVPRICKDCRTVKQLSAYPVSAQQQIKKEFSAMPNDPDMYPVADVSHPTLYQSDGCDTCTDSAKQTALWQLTPWSERLAAFVQSGAIDAHQLNRTVGDNALLSLRQDAVLKAMRGEIDLLSAWSASI